MTVLAFSTGAQALDSLEYVAKVKQYVNQYKDLAMIEQMHSGMPAAVILAQAVLETEAGSSELVIGANNHFGIKCKTGWTGQTYTHNDDQPNECFRKYRSVAESYKDHSDYLKNTPRYAPLFKISVTDYAGWAMSLKQCGYATNPIYAQRLIGIIEDYHLQEYTYLALSPTAENVMQGTIAEQKADPVKPATPKSPVLDTFAFKSAVKPVKSRARIIMDSMAAIDSIKNATAIAMLAKDTFRTEPVPIPARILDTNAAIVNVPVSKHVDVPKDTAMPVKETVAATIKQDTADTNVPANINTVAAAKPVVSEPMKQTSEPRLQTVHGLRAVFMHKGDMLLEIATKQNIRYAKLLDMNDLPDAPLASDMYVYLEKKSTAGTKSSHVVVAGETLHQVSQAEGVQLKKLMAYNHLQAGQEPATGTKLFLQAEAPLKPIIVKTPEQKPKPVETTAPANAMKPQIADNYVSTETPLNNTVVATEAAAQNMASANPAAVPAAEPDNANNNAKEVPKDKLASLKSKLDKVVYTDDYNKAETPPQVTPATPANAEVFQAPAKKSPKPSADSSKYYTVKSGDTAYSIAHRFNITIRQLNNWNNMDDGDIKKGMKLRVKP